MKYSVHQLLSLRGKVALVTGGSGGIGSAVSKLLAQEGATVVINYVKSSVRAEALANEIRSLGGIAVAYRADVSKSIQVSRMIEYTETQFDNIDLLINNAGIVSPDHILSPLVVLAESMWDRQLGVNLKGAYLCSKAVVPLMLEQQHGKIVNVSSVSALTGTPYSIAYGASKAGLVSLTRSFAVGLAPTVQVNCVAPYYVETGFGGPMSNEFRQEIIRSIPAKRFGDPKEVANLIAYLCGAPSYVTGHMFVIDGGHTKSSSLWG